MSYVEIPNGEQYTSTFWRVAETTAMTKLDPESGDAPGPLFYSRSIVATKDA